MVRLQTIVLLLLTACGSRIAAVEPTKSYKKETINEFTVYFSKDVVKHRDDLDGVRRELEIQTSRINKSVADEPLKKLRKIKIWVEWDAEENKKIVARFLTAGHVEKNKLNPDKGDSIVVVNSKLFIDAPNHGSPCVIIHELAHSYHILHLEKKNGKIEAAFKQAVDRKLYDDVEHFNGFRAKGYAVTNEYEYFATLTESYFGKSANFPYDKPGLLRYDTQGYWMMEEMWGKPK